MRKKIDNDYQMINNKKDRKERNHRIRMKKKPNPNPKQELNQNNPPKATIHFNIYTAT